LTNKRFLPDPFSTVPGTKLYRSGDLAQISAKGELEYLGRMDHQVKIAGSGLNWVKSNRRLTAIRRFEKAS